MTTRLGIDSNSAPFALQSLTAAQSALATSERRLSTGHKIDTAKDDGAGFAISRHIKAQLAEQSVLRQNQLRARSLLDVTQGALDGITDLLVSLREKAAGLMDTSLSASAQASIRNDMTALVKQIDGAAKTATFNTIKLLNPDPVVPSFWNQPYPGLVHNGTSTATYNTGTSAGTFDLPVDLQSVTSASINVDWGDGTTYASNQTWGAPYNGALSVTHAYADSGSNRAVTFSMSASGPGPAASSGFYIPWLNFTPDGQETPIAAYTGGQVMNIRATDMTAQGLSLDNLANLTPAQVLPAVDAALRIAENAGAYYGTRQKAMDGLLAHNSKLSDALEAADGRLVDADMSKEAAAWQAGQARVSLATTALNIANQSPRMLLSLFR
ncbi:MAG: flagellin [Asticcacaulis sp.]|nr:flagellin [Asticcacaulis sp.]